MLTLNYINKRTAADYQFTGQFGEQFGEQVVLVNAKSLAAARQRLIKHFKPKKGELKDLRVREGEHASVP